MAGGESRAHSRASPLGPRYARAVSEGDVAELLREVAPHLLRADPETETYLARLEERNDELYTLVERLLVEDLAARG